MYLGEDLQSQNNIINVERPSLTKGPNGPRPRGTRGFGAHEIRRDKIFKGNSHVNREVQE